MDIGGCSLFNIGGNPCQKYHLEVRKAVNFKLYPVGG
jgi:hypothetical protein